MEVPMVPMGIFGQNGRFQGLWGFPMPLFGGPKGPNRSPWMCLTMSNLVQPMSNPFGAAGDAYGRKWPSLAEYGPFWGLWGLPVPFFGVMRAKTYADTVPPFYLDNK